MNDELNAEIQDLRGGKREQESYELPPSSISPTSSRFLFFLFLFYVFFVGVPRSSYNYRKREKSNGGD